MEADLWPHTRKRFSEGVGIAQVCLHERSRLRHVLRAAAGEVIDDGDLVAPRDERVDDVRADEARSPCHHRPHARLSYGRPMFISFEGVDGSGKTTQAELLGQALRAQGRDVVETREPGGTTLGEQIRELILHGDEMAPWAEASLFAAARAQLVDEVIRPALARGADVICDRYIDSSLAYQGIARGLGVERVLELNQLATAGLMPDRTFVLLVPLEEASRRRGDDPDRLEREGIEFVEFVDRAYRELAQAFPTRIVPADGTQAPEELARLIRGQLRDVS